MTLDLGMCRGITLVKWLLPNQIRYKQKPSVLNVGDPATESANWGYGCSVGKFLCDTRKMSTIIASSPRLEHLSFKACRNIRAGRSRKVVKSHTGGETCGWRYRSRLEDSHHCESNLFITELFITLTALTILKVLCTVAHLCMTTATPETISLRLNSSYTLTYVLGGKPWKKLLEKVSEKSTP